MTPAALADRIAALADRIAALDWSATSLQHQLAVGCAVETLRNAEAAPSSNSVIPCPNPDGCNWPACPQVCPWRPGRVKAASDPVSLAFARPTPANLYQPERLTRLRRVSDQSLAAVAYCTARDKWEWVCRAVAEDTGCDAQQVGVEGDRVTVAGVATFILC